MCLLISSDTLLSEFSCIEIELKNLLAHLSQELNLELFLSPAVCSLSFFETFHIVDLFKEIIGEVSSKLGTEHT